MGLGPPGDRAPRAPAAEAVELAHDLFERQRALAVQAATALAGLQRAEAIADDAIPGRAMSPPARPTRWGWRRSVRFAVERRMYTPAHVALYARYLSHRLRHPHVELQGMVFLGRRVELLARRGHGRLVVGPWCWIGSGNSLRAHEGNLRLGSKVVMGSNNVVNAYLDIEIGGDSLLSDWIYISDFDHRHVELHRPIRKQGLVKSPVRIGQDVWVGEKASILRGADIGTGSVIGSHSLVKGVIPPYSIAVGTPARVVRSRLPAGMTVEEALDLRQRGTAIPGDPLGT